MPASLASTSAPSTYEKSGRRDPAPNTSFLDGSKEAAAARATYLKIYLGGTFMIILLIFGIMSIFWGALWKIPAHNLPGWVVVSWDCGQSDMSLLEY